MASGHRALAMPGLTRRRALGLLGTAAWTWSAPRRLWALTPARVVVIGGGFGGATCAKYLRRADPTLDVTLVEPQRQFITCPLSNAVLAGLQDLTFVTQSYTVLQQRYGLRLLQATAVALDPTGHRITLDDGTSLAYDRLVLAPGIACHWGALEGYDAAASTTFPHAWQAGPQTLLLRQQLAAMPDGGLVIIAVPENPYRCPPGPYERASLMAHYLKTHKPRSKLLVLDAKDTFTKHDLFRSAWARLYPGVLEWVPGSQSGKVVRVDAKTGTLYTDFEEYKPAVANVIPPQYAAAIARAADLDAGTGWCTVHPRTFESTVHPDVHLIGDAIIATPMPKSAFSANTHAKACAAALVALLRGTPAPEPVLMNTCYSLVAPDYGISITGVYRVVGERIVAVEGSEGTSPLQAPEETRAREAAYALSWYANITADTFA